METPSLALTVPGFCDPALHEALLQAEVSAATELQLVEPQTTVLQWCMCGLRSVLQQDHMWPNSR